MRSLWVSYIVSIFLLGFLSLGVYWFYYPTGFSSMVFTSPLPQMLSLLHNKQVTSLNLWNPSSQVLGTVTMDLPITGESVLSYDLTNEKILYEKNASKQYPMASLTKIMTAIIALEHPKDDNKYLVHGSDLVGEDSMGLMPGEVLSLKELLYGLILHSGNDAAEVLASNFSGGSRSFIKAMNDKAASLGLGNTIFDNPTGLQGDGQQHTTARDLLVMTRYALTNFPLFGEIAATVTTDIPKTATHQEYYIENETNLVGTYPGVKGIKTGYTPEAGLCLVTYLEYQNQKIIAVLLGSENRRADMKKILDYSLSTLGVSPPDHE